MEVGRIVLLMGQRLDGMWPHYDVQLGVRG